MSGQSLSLAINPKRTNCLRSEAFIWKISEQQCATFSSICIISVIRWLTKKVGGGYIFKRKNINNFFPIADQTTTEICLCGMTLFITAEVLLGKVQCLMWIVWKPVFSLSTHKSFCLSLFSFICFSCFASTDWPYLLAVSNAQHIRKQWERWACSQEPYYGSCEWGFH